MTSPPDQPGAVRQRVLGKLRRGPRLANPGLPDDGDEGSLAGNRSIERRTQPAELRLPSDEHGTGWHGSDLGHGRGYPSGDW